MKGYLYLILFCAVSSISVECSVKERVSFSISDESDVTLYNDNIEEDIRIMVISDTHLWQSDEREDPYRKYSDRMAAAYNETEHIRTHRKTTPSECLESAAEYASDNDMDAIVCIGDMVSYPSEYAIESMKSVLDKTGIEWYYVAGNHDWHYEGIEGSQNDVRSEWVKKRLMPLYAEGVDPMCYNIIIKGLNLLFIDDSICEITEQQLAFFRYQDNRQMPMILFMHVPLYAPGTPVGYSIGHPDWNQMTDPSYIIERREPWPIEGHSDITFSFRKEVLESENVIAVFSGHVHTNSMYCQNGIPCFTVAANYQGGYYDLRILKTRK